MLEKRKNSQIKSSGLMMSRLLVRSGTSTSGRLGSVRADGALDLGVQLPQPPGEREMHRAPQQGEPTDEPRDGQRAVARRGEQEHAACDAQDAGGREHPVVAQHLAEAVRVTELEQASEQGPERDEV